MTLHVCTKAGIKMRLYLQVSDRLLLIRITVHVIETEAKILEGPRCTLGPR